MVGTVGVVEEVKCCGTVVEAELCARCLMVLVFGESAVWNGLKMGPQKNFLYVLVSQMNLYAPTLVRHSFHYLHMGTNNRTEECLHPYQLFEPPSLHS